ncbi:MAG: four helix bundle protein [Blastocatellia bacterium]|nr:four helix bundle protein [Blastocatellia bacterium]
MNPKIERFEDLIAWQKARKLTTEVYKATQNQKFAKDWGLSNQIQRAVVSIMANIAEGFERGKRSEFHHFLSIAKASCAEVRCHLYVAFDIGYLCESQFQQLNLQAHEVSRILGGLRSAVERQRDNGNTQTKPIST